MLKTFLRVCRRSPGTMMADVIGVAALGVLLVGSLYLPGSFA
ncbi:MULTISPECIES: hypothetical protein [Pseudooceanicola]|nr:MULTISPECIES: hypothetical protein [Pseudooceanicola]